MLGILDYVLGSRNYEPFYGHAYFLWNFLSGINFLVFTVTLFRLKAIQIYMDPFNETPADLKRKLYKLRMLQVAYTFALFFCGGREFAAWYGVIWMLPNYEKWTWVNMTAGAVSLII